MTPSWIERLRNEVGPGRVIDEEAEISRSTATIGGRSPQNGASRANNPTALMWLCVRSTWVK